MTGDRPSREYRIVHEAGTGLPVLEPLTDPPPTREVAAPAPPAPSYPPSRRAASWAALAAAVLGSGGVGAVVQAARGDSETARAVAALTVQVQTLTGQVTRLEAAQAKTGEDVAHLRGQLEPLANVRGRISEAESRLRQPPAPDVRGALRALDQQ